MAVAASFALAPFLLVVSAAWLYTRLSNNFVGFLLNGLPGATAATLGMFAPAVLLTVLATPLLLRYGPRYIPRSGPIT